MIPVETVSGIGDKREGGRGEFKHNISDTL
jgi:hypothetical protein